MCKPKDPEGDQYKLKTLLINDIYRRFKYMYNKSFDSRSAQKIKYPDDNMKALVFVYLP